MEEIQDYYAFLGVHRDAAADEIKRAYARKRREYQNDETKSTQLNQAYEVLCDSAKRKQYDLNMQYGNQVEDIKEKIRNSETLEQRNKYLVDAKKIYLDILKTDAENTDALWNLVGIENSLGNDTQAIQYLKQLEKCVEEDDKLQVYHRLGEIYRRLEKVDEAIKCYHAIYKADVTYAEDIKILVRLCYEDKKNLKAAIQILNDCINRSAESRLKIVYLYETLRAIRLLKVSSYQKVEDTLYKKLETFYTDNEESNLVNAATVLTCFKDIIDRKDFECFHRMEQIYLAYGIKNAELNQTFRAVQQILSLMERDKVHKAIDLYLEEQWTKEIREQIGKLIIKEAEQIKASLENIKKDAPECWKWQTELADLEKLVNENLTTSKEFNSLSNDRAISYYMKKMIECLLLDGFVAIEDMKDEFIEARDSFFDKEDRGKFEHTLRKMEAYYPICYKLFADIFFEGKSVDELASGSHARKVEPVGANDANAIPYYPSAKNDYVHRPYISGWLELLFIIVGTCCFPPILPIVLITKYYNRHEKAVKRFLKKLLVIGIIVLIIALIGSAVWFVNDWKEKQYEDAHNGWLTDKELEKADDLASEYNRKTDVDIKYIQREEGDGSQAAYEGPYIYLVYSSMGFSFELGSHTLYSNCLTKDENQQLADMLGAMVEDEELSDMEICEQFFEITYDFITERGIPHGQDVNSDQQQNNKTEDNDETGNHQQDGENNAFWEIDMNMMFYAMATNCMLDEFAADIHVEPFEKFSYQNGGSKGLFYASLGEFTGKLHYSDTEEIGFYLETDEPVRENEVAEIFNAVPTTSLDGDNQIFVWNDKVKMDVYYNSYSTVIYFSLCGSDMITEDDTGSTEEEMVSGEWNVYLEDLYEIFRKNNTFEQVKNKYPTGILTEVDNYLLEYYGYVGAYKGYFSYCSGCPVYGIGDESLKYEHFSWSSDFGTWCSNEYLCEEWGLTYVDSGYSACNGALITIYDWNKKLVVIVLQAEGSHTLIQILPRANYPINYW